MTALYDPQNETLEPLGRAGFRLIQPRRLFRYGTDSVLLADFAAKKAFSSAVDLGTGSGVIPLLMLARRPACRIDAIEIDPYMAELAARNFDLNETGERLRAFCGDLREAAGLLGREKYEIAVSNPPYYDADASLQGPDGTRNRARQDGSCTAEELCRAAFALIRNGGRFFVIWPSARLPEMFAAMTENRIAPKRIRCVEDAPGKVCRLVLLEGVKNGGAGLEWLPPLYLHDENGGETEEYRRIYYPEEE